MPYYQLEYISKEFLQLWALAVNFHYCCRKSFGGSYGKFAKFRTFHVFLPFKNYVTRYNAWEGVGEGATKHYGGGFNETSRNQAILVTILYDI